MHLELALLALLGAAGAVRADKSQREFNNEHRFAATPVAQLHAARAAPDPGSGQAFNGGNVKSVCMCMMVTETPGAELPSYTTFTKAAGSEPSSCTDQPSGPGGGWTPPGGSSRTDKHSQKPTNTNEHSHESSDSSKPTGAESNSNKPTGGPSNSNKSTDGLSISDKPTDSLSNSNKPADKPSSTKEPTHNPTMTTKTTTGDKSICTLAFEDVKGETLKNTWKESGAGDWLHDYLKDNGVEDWGDNIFQDTIAKGEQGGSTYDCQTFLVGRCPLPEDKPCETYTPREMFFIQISMSNLFNAFDKMDRRLNDEGIKGLGETTSEIEGKFDESEGSVIPYLIGAVAFGAAAAGPLWAISAPATSIIAGLNIAAGIQAENEVDEGDNLKDQVTNLYKAYKKKLATAVEVIFSGNFDKVKDQFDGDKVDFITGSFADGKMLDKERMEDSVDQYIQGFETLMKHSLIFKCLSDNDWELLRYDTKEKHCSAQTDGNGIWMRTKDGEQCVTISKEGSNGNDWYGRSFWQSLSKDKTKAMKDEYKINLKKAYQSILDCDGGELDLSQDPPMEPGDDSPYPKCILPMKTAVKT